MVTDSSEPQKENYSLIDPQKWVDTYADYLFKYAVKRVNDEELARDLVQETFLAALQRVDRFEGRSSERTWLTTILKNKVIDVYRKKSSVYEKNKQSLDANWDTNFFEQEDGHWKEEQQPQQFSFEPHDILHGKEFDSILQRCMQKLPSLWISVFRMKHMEDEDTNTICAQLKVTPSNFWVIIHRSKVSLRACLQKNWI